ncbi:conserved hypothetical protein [Solidesulfovibrio fructosivorans JJ]]|uniref:Phosphate transport regulator n=1 Tax=Solidesulfovibrio fructosivorans JJ] TaxID=596151 RepID=E1JTF7_SOLFR|nr:DUF47 family protein [Solidesulfovibrio fructosivorans]EFL52417.1 conserved hypothetical protein [Solidesulfovibrio fructosivorans JJ]]
MLPRALRFLGPRRKDYLPGLCDHYRPVARGMALLAEALRHCLDASPDDAFAALVGEIDILEGAADKIKRRIRNHLPAAGLMVVDKTLFLDYTKRQDDILDAVLDAAVWLDRDDFVVPPPLRPALEDCVAEAARGVELLEPALAGTVDYILCGGGERDALKKAMQAVRDQHRRVIRAKRALVAAAYGTDMEFGRVYQVVRFVEYVYRASRKAENCADILRAMLAR